MASNTYFCDDIFPGLSYTPEAVEPSELPHQKTPEADDASTPKAEIEETEDIDVTTTPPLPSNCTDIITESQAFITMFTSSVPTAFPFGSPAHPPYIPIKATTATKFASYQMIRQRAMPPATAQQECDPAVPEGLLTGGKRPSLLARVNLTEAEKAALLAEANKPPSYSASLERQNEKILRIYQAFVKEMGAFDAFPLSPISAVSFLVWLAKSGCYCAKSIDYVAWPALCRLNILQTQQHVCQYVESCARAKIAQIYRDPSVKKSGPGMTPLIVDDVSRIVAAMPKQASRTSMLASLFLFAMSTGCRGDSCSHVRLCDFFCCRENPDGCLLVGVRIIKLKSRPGESIELTIAGYPQKESPVDVVYWINKYLLESFDISLRALCEGESSGDRFLQRVWNLTTDAMTRALKVCLEDAGFSSKGFGFHSFRSGFLSDVLAVAGAKGESVQDGLTKAALVTGWTPLSAIEMNYIKQPARRNIIATNLIGVTSTPSHCHAPSFTPDPSASTNTTNTHLTPSSTDFHYLKAITPLQTKKYRSFAFEIKHLLGKKLNLANASKAQNYSYLTSSYIWCLIRFGRAFLAQQQSVESDSSDAECRKYTSNELRKMGLRLVNQRLQQNPRSAPLIAQEMFKMLQQANKIKVQLKPVKLPALYVCKGPQRKIIETVNGKHRRERKEWAEEEERIFMSGILNLKTAKQIADKLYIRTPEDVRLHLRAVNYKRAHSSPPLPALKLQRAPPKKRETTVKKN